MRSKIGQLCSPVPLGIALAVALMSSAPAAAQSITVTGGYLDMNFTRGPLVLTGSRGFTLQGMPFGPSGRFDPSFCNPCPAGSTLSMAAVWTGPDLAWSVATLDGVTYRNGGGDFGPKASITFSGSVVLPPIASSATVSAPFSMTGTFAYFLPDTSSVSNSFAANGTATLTLAADPSSPNRWDITRVVYVFDSSLSFPWASADIGSVGQSGSASFSNNSFDISGSGADIWGSADAFHFASQLMLAGSGNGVFNRADGIIVAHVVAEQDTSPFAKAGVMIRQSYDAASPFVILDVKPDGGVEFMTRSASAESTTFVGGAAAGVPVWLKLTIAGSTVTGEVSMDGASWSVLGSTGFSVPQAPFIGLAVTSHDTSIANEAIFDHVAVTFTTNVLPPPWGQADVGAVGQAGGVSVSNGTFSVSGAGADIWGTADAFHYVYQQLNGDAQIVARVTSEQNTDPHAKAGVMLRQSLTEFAADVILDIQPDGGIEFMTRSASGGSTTFIAGSALSFPAWLRLVRSGGTVTASVSQDGSAWLALGSTAIDLTSPAFIGLAVTSHDTSALNTAIFDQVSITTGVSGNCSASPLPSTWTAQDIGTVGVAGSSCYANGVFTISGAGSDIWGTADSFQYASHPVSGDGDLIVARVTGEQNTDPFAKAGVMLRQDFTPGSPDVVLDVKPDGEIEFMARSSSDGETTFIASGPAASSFPVWLKLTRSNGTVTGSVSSDGVTWIAVGSVGTSITSAASVGLAVTSHNASVLNAATFDNVTF